MVWNFSLSKVILVWGKARSCRVPNLSCSRAESPGWFEFSPKICAWDVLHEWVHFVWWSCQSPVAHSCSLLIYPNSFHGGVFKVKAKSDANSLLYLLSHFECNDHTIHMLTQWRLPPPLTNTVQLLLFTHVHSNPLSLAAKLYWCRTNCSHYINIGWSFSGPQWFH